MKLRLGRVVSFAAIVAGFVAALALLSPGLAAAAPAAVKKIEALNGKAITAYEAGDFQRAEALLLDAVVMAKQNQLGTHAAAARTYLNLGLVNIDGLKNVEKGERYFTLALRIDPRTQM